MPTVAEQLRQARETKKLTVQQAADLTKIKSDHIRALEEGHFEGFSAPVYVRGFVRIYGTILGLDVARLLTDLDNELTATPKFRDAPGLAEHPRTPMDIVMFQLSKVNWRVALFLSLVLLALALAYWSYRSWQSRKNTDPLRNLNPGLYRPGEPHRGELLPLPTNAPRR
jgi:cytoskeletal protein RodZ